jgi:anti-sigma regulatory factor (Ser/Thr protein kinase)
MARHVLFVDEMAASPVEAALSGGWRVTRVGEGRRALSWLRHTHPELILVGPRPADLSAVDFVRAVKADHASSLLPVVQVGADVSGLDLAFSVRLGRVRAEPDAWLHPDRPAEVNGAIAEALAARAERQREGARADLRLSVSSSLEVLDEVNHLFGGWFAACGFGSQACQQLTLAVRELVANAIEWGHGLDQTRDVSVHARLDHEKASVLVRDSGPGFDPTAVPHAARPGDPLGHLAVRSSLRLREGGFGILMTRGMVDQLCYNASGNEACVVKYLPSKKGTGDRG